MAPLYIVASSGAYAADAYDVNIRSMTLHRNILSSNSAETGRRSRHVPILQQQPYPPLAPCFLTYTAHTRAPTHLLPHTPLAHTTATTHPLPTYPTLPLLYTLARYLPPVHTLHHPATPCHTHTHTTPPLLSLPASHALSCSGSHCEPGHAGPLFQVACLWGGGGGGQARGAGAAAARKSLYTLPL